MIKTLYIGSSSACFELDSQTQYYSPNQFEVLLNGETVTKADTNVFSIFDLRPDTEYTAEVRFPNTSERVSFKTTTERFCANVKDFGAVGDGSHEDTVAIQTAINLLPDHSRLYFPRGVYLTLPLVMRSHITLELAEGAVLRAVTDRSRYPIVPKYIKDADGNELQLSSFEGNEEDAYVSLIHGSYCEDVTIVGRGALDGNGQNGDWWHGFNEFPAKRPRAVYMNRCKDITLHGITVENSPAWHIHPIFSQNISILDVFITAPKDSPNTDAIDPESCDNVKIIGCRFSVGDDCIAVKSGKIDMARKFKTPASNHVIRNCLMDFGHGALTLGSELAGGIKNVTVTQCWFRGTDRGLRIKSRRGRGKDSVITDVVFDDIRMEKVKTPIVINMWYNCCDPDRYTEYVWSRDKLPVDDRTPHLGDFRFSNMVCTEAQAAACYIDGLPESPIDSVTMENIQISFAEDAQPFVPAMQNFAEPKCRLGLYLDNVTEVTVKNVTVTGAEGDGLVTNHCGNITTEGFESK